jgi:hypothetical protein
MLVEGGELAGLKGCGEGGEGDGFGGGGEVPLR